MINIGNGKLVLLLATAACGGGVTATAPHSITPVDAGIARVATSPLKLELVATTVRGTLFARVGDDEAWQPLAQGASLSGVREVRAARRGAMLSIGHGDAGGRLWLRAGASVRIGQDESGTIHVEARAGRSRIRRTASALPLTVASIEGPIAIEGDYLLDARSGPENPTSVDARVIPTGARPELADWSLALEERDEATGVGRMDVTAADKTEPLALRKVSVDVKTAGDVAVTQVEHVFYNPADQPREGTFRFPVPDGAMLTGMAMEIDGKMVEGEIVEKDKARAIYEQIVDEMQDPALLEWEEGNWFKLRVFPIEAMKEKRVVIRYTAPLARGAGGLEYGFALGAPDPALPIGELSITVDGVAVATEKQVAAGIDISVPVGIDKVPAVMTEVKKDGTYTAVRIPAPAGLAKTAKVAKKVVVIVDTSRSALEAKPLQLELLKTALGELSTTDRFIVLASDVSVTPHAKDGYRAIAPDAIAKAVSFVDAIEPDGASDLAAALTAAAALEPTDVIYVGDGIPTWGERGTAALGELADKIKAPIHAGLVGKGASTELWAEVAGRSGGRALVVRRSIDARRFALAAAHAGDVARMSTVRLELPAGAIAYPAHATTLYAGDELVTLIKTPAGQPAPDSLVLTGVTGGVAKRSQISLAKPVQVAHVHQRWAAFRLADLDRNGAEREEIVALSQDAGLMSRYTSLLVLENDEAFKKYQIARKQQAAADAAARVAKVTGGDLDTLGTARASLSPDEIQPGDPEIKIPAPADARSVLVHFPFGETKQAVWDADAAAWMVRFLIDKDTPDGDYHVRVTITLADGRIETLSLSYTVDTAPPAVQLAVTKVPGGYRFRATQVASTGGSLRKDADRVEIVLPDGTQLVLAQTAWGRFEGTWLTAQLAAPTALRVITRDRALNQGTSQVVVGQ